MSPFRQLYVTQPIRTPSASTITLALFGLDAEGTGRKGIFLQGVLDDVGRHPALPEVVQAVVGHVRHDGRLRRGHHRRNHDAQNGTYRSET